MDNRLAFIFGRRSIRRFNEGKISERNVRAILEAAMAAPSAAGKDPWRFVVVSERERLERLADGLPNGQMLREASFGILVCGDKNAAHRGEISYLLQDCSAAIENILLAVHLLELGAVWLGIHPRADRIAHAVKSCGLPENIIPVSAVAVGFPGEKKEPRTRFNPDFVHYESW